MNQSHSATTAIASAQSAAAPARHVPVVHDVQVASMMTYFIKSGVKYLLRSLSVFLVELMALVSLPAGFHTARAVSSGNVNNTALALTRGLGDDSGIQISSEEKLVCRSMSI